MAITKEYAVDTEEANSAILGRFKVSPREGEALAAREEREDKLYQQYQAALDRGEVPHAATLKAALALLAKPENPRMIRELAQRLARRRILIVFQDRLGTSEVNAFGHLFQPGERRTVEIDGEEGERETMDVLKNGVIKISTDFVDSSIGTAAILAHELAHVIERENAFNGVPPPGEVDIGGGDTVSSSEQWADYFAGKTLDALGFDENAILDKPRHDAEWGPRWAETYGVLRGMHQLYRAVGKGTVIEDAKIWEPLRTTLMVEAFLGTPMTYRVDHSVKGTRTEIQPGGVAADNKKHCSGILALLDAPKALHWQGRHFTVDGTSDLGFKVTAQGDIDASGRYLLRFDVNVVYPDSYPLAGGSCRFRLKNLPLAHRWTSPAPVFSYELYGPEAGRHVKGLAGDYGRQEAPPDDKTPPAVERWTYESADWSGGGNEPYLQVIFSTGYTQKRQDLAAAKL